MCVSADFFVSPHGIPIPKGLIVYRCEFFLIPFFFLFSTSNLWGHWQISTNSDTYSLMTAIWIFVKFGPNYRLFGPTLYFDRTYLCNGTRYQQSGKNLLIYRDSPTCPQISWPLVQKRLRMVGEFLPSPLNFCIGRHCQPYHIIHMDVILWQTAGKPWHVLCSGTLAYSL